MREADARHPVILTSGIPTWFSRRGHRRQRISSLQCGWHLKGDVSPVADAKQPQQNRVKRRHREIAPHPIDEDERQHQRSHGHLHPRDADSVIVREDVTQEAA
jgi:hypothetical protein